ncbi:MAG: hypothetical protein LUC93_14100 [Planctomycetaceae bacterium]|nr:hypothetical protein [Planctomycetaceae bacterium]
MQVWNDVTDYTKGDLVKCSVNDKIYQCLQASGPMSGEGPQDPINNKAYRTHYYWTGSTSLGFQPNDLIFGNGRVVGTYIYNKAIRAKCTEDLVAWTQIPEFSFAATSARFEDGKFIFSNDDYIASSVDGIQYTITTSDEITVPDPTNQGEIFRRANGNGKVVLIDSNGIWGHVRNQDSTTWESYRLPQELKYLSLVFGNGLFVIITDTDLLVSSDGLNWEYRINPLQDIWLKSIFFGKDKFIVFNGRGVAHWSNDCLDWHELVIPDMFRSKVEGKYQDGWYMLSINDRNYKQTQFLVSQDCVRWSSLIINATNPTVRTSVVFGGPIFYHGNLSYRYVPYQEICRTHFWTEFDTAPIGSIITTVVEPSDLLHYVVMDGRYVRVGDYPELCKWAEEKNLFNTTAQNAKFHYSTDRNTFRPPIRTGTAGSYYAIKAV